MKAFINLFIGSMFCIEIMSPFVLGYLNQEQNSKNKSPLEQRKPQARRSVRPMAGLFSVRDWKKVDFGKTESNFSDSKSLNVQEHDLALGAE